MYTPQKEECGSSPLPVIAYIYGGGFVDGFSDELGPDFLIEKCIILVTMNYRVGSIGFLSLALPEYSGNMGLKDQQLALQWIYENIDAFGGNNKLITILGQNAGKKARFSMKNKKKKFPITAQSDFTRSFFESIEKILKNILSFCCCCYRWIIGWLSYTE